MKIAITGAQSTGKSTLLQVLKRLPELEGFEFVEELTRSIRNKGLNINEDGDVLTQALTVTSHVDTILHKHFISDRCCIDGYVYTRYLHKKGKVPDWMLMYAENILETILPKYDHIFYLPPEIPLIEDGVRSVDVDFQTEIVGLFKETIKDFKLQDKITTLSGSVSERVNKFLDVVYPSIIPSFVTEITDFGSFKSVDKYTRKYLKAAISYWAEKGRFNPSIPETTKILKFSNGVNNAWAFMYLEYWTPDQHWHLSRFVVEKRGDGFGSKVMRYLTSEYGKLVLWANPKAVDFYKKHGFIMHEKITTEVPVDEFEPHYEPNKTETYIYGQYNK